MDLLDQVGVVAAEAENEPIRVLGRLESEHLLEEAARPGQVTGGHRAARQSNRLEQGRPMRPRSNYTHAFSRSLLIYEAQRFGWTNTHRRPDSLGLLRAGLLDERNGCAVIGNFEDVRGDGDAQAGALAKRTIDHDSHQPDSNMVSPYLSSVTCMDKWLSIDCLGLRP
jgi:hypothetical protein